MNIRKKDNNWTALGWPVTVTHTRHDALRHRAALALPFPAVAKGLQRKGVFLNS